MTAPICLIAPRTASLAVRGLTRRNPARSSAAALRVLPPHSPSPGSQPSCPRRSFHAAPLRARMAHNNEPVPTEAPTTDFSKMDVLANTPAPATSVDACAPDGFSLGGGSVEIGGGAGALLVGGEAFVWRPWDAQAKRLVNAKGQWEVPDPERAFGLFASLWPRPDLLILGLGPENRPLSPATRKHIASLGMRVEVLDTRNAANQFNLLATERGVDDVAAALIPLGWKEGVGAR